MPSGGMGGYGSTYGAGSYGSSTYGRPMGTMGSYGGYGSSMGGGYGSSYGGGMYGQRPYGGYNSYGSGIGGGYAGAPYGAGAMPGQIGRSFRFRPSLLCSTIEQTSCMQTPFCLDCPLHRRVLAVVHRMRLLHIDRGVGDVMLMLTLSLSWRDGPKFVTAPVAVPSSCPDTVLATERFGCPGADHSNS